MKHSEVIKLYENLSQVKGLSGAKVNYAVLRNLKNLEVEIEVYKKQEEEINDITKEYSSLVELTYKNISTINGEVKTKTNEKGQTIYDIHNSKRPELKQILDGLALKHKKEIDSANEKWTALLKFRMENESEFKPITVKVSDLPSDISTENMNFLFNIIEPE